VPSKRFTGGGGGGVGSDAVSSSEGPHAARINNVSNKYKFFID
tara:strand:+ start:5 stop:133 length:129 start_codon:yes stop_codon:yes gene_type:complete